MEQQNESTSTKPGLNPCSWHTWKKIFSNLPARFKQNQVVIVAGGVSFYFFLSVFPALAAIISIYGILTSPAEVQHQMSQLASVLPVEAQSLVKERLSKLAQNSGTLKWQLVLSTLLSIWITNVGTRALFRGVNMAYGKDIPRKNAKEIGITILFTIGGILFYIIAMAILLGYPVLADQLSLSSSFTQLLKWLKWPVFAFILAAALTLVYRFAPVGQKPQYKKIIWGAIIATLLWMGSSWLFSFGVSKVGVAPSYGPLAAVAILMLWFLLSCFAILLGAEINSELEGNKTVN